MLTGRFAWVSVSLFQALRRASWPGLTRGLLLIALAGCCATVLAARAYLQFDRVRVKVVTTERQASGGSVVVPLPELSSLAGFRPAVILQLENRNRVATTVAVSINDAELTRAVLPPERTVRVDLNLSAIAGSALARAREGSYRLHVRGEGGGWSLHYLEFANIHGFSRGIVNLVIVPAGSDHYDAPSGAVSLAVFGLLGVLTLARLGFAKNQAVRLTQTALGMLVLTFLVTTLVLPMVSNYKVLLSVGTFWLCVAILYSPVLVRVAKPPYSVARAGVAWLWVVVGQGGADGFGMV